MLRSAGGSGALGIMEIHPHPEQVRLLQSLCPKDCSDVGVCEEGKCFCPQGFKGEDCSIRTCKDDCTRHGVCISGGCQCYTGWAGEACDQVDCPNSCSGKGACNNGTCVCQVLTLALARALARA